MPKPPVNDVLMDAAEQLICRHGVHGAGIDAILKESGRSSRSLYQHFGSKEGLALAALKRRDARWMAGLRATVSAEPDPELRLLAIFDTLETWFRQPDFHGCPFMTVAGEIHDRAHPLRAAVEDHKRALLGFIAETTKAAGFIAHTRLAREVFLLVEGAIAAALVSGQPAAARTGRRAAAVMMAAHRKDDETAMRPGGAAS